MMKLWCNEFFSQKLRMRPTVITNRPIICHTMQSYLNMWIVKILSGLQVICNNRIILHRGHLLGGIKERYGMQAVKTVSNNTIKMQLKWKENGLL